MTDAYLQSLLATGETIRSEARQHPMALIRFALQPILVFLGAVLLFGVGTWLTPDGEGLFNNIVRWIDTLIGLLTAGMFILAIAWFPIQVFRWTKRRYMVTDRRVLYVEGVWRKNSADAGLSMITDVGFRQTMLGRSLGFGDLQISTASNRPLNFREIRDALAFKQAIMSAQQGTIEARADEIMVSKGLTPSVAAPVAAAAVAATPAAPVEPAPPPVPAWDGSDVPQMLEDDTPAIDPMILGADEPVSEAAAEPVADEPVSEAAAEPVADEPVSEAAAEPVADEPVSEAAAEPVADEPVSEAAAEPAPPTGHADALGSIDSTVGDLTDDAKDVGADTVTAALASLADERDAGAITDEQFESRKQELLDRL